VQQIVAINLANLQQIFTRYNLPRQGVLAAWLTAAERDMGQLEADSGFYTARTRQAQIALTTLQVRAEIWRAQIEKEENRLAERRNLILGLVSAVGVILALGEVIDNNATEAFLRWLGALVQFPLSDPVPAGTIFWVRFILIMAPSFVAGMVWGISRLVHRLRQRRLWDHSRNLSSTPPPTPAL